MREPRVGASLAPTTYLFLKVYRTPERAQGMGASECRSLFSHPCSRVVIGTSMDAGNDPEECALYYSTNHMEVSSVRIRTRLVSCGLGVSGPCWGQNDKSQPTSRDLSSMVFVDLLGQASNTWKSALSNVSASMRRWATATSLSRWVTNTSLARS